MIMVAATQRGLSIEDFKDMEIGQINDYIITYNNSYHSEEKKKDKPMVIKATQADFDNF
ncbi:hypothetical protein [Miniphocaeibacter massiliensis]|uniref:hypothetical protein n=1 Tax=Miniphocaeibacter massiliensis TaxID=2041841 RepID=UPI0013EB2447|nr:hypothetical protein [Miniphocaeibacter massiliensis]